MSSTSHCAPRAFAARHASKAVAAASAPCWLSTSFTFRRVAHSRICSLAAGAESVARAEQNRTAFFLNQVRELGCGGRLSRAVHAYKTNDGRIAVGRLRQIGLRAFENFTKDVGSYLRGLFSAQFFVAAVFLFYGIDNLRGRFVAEIGAVKSFLNQRDVGLVDFLEKQRRQRIERDARGFLQTFLESF